MAWALQEKKKPGAQKILYRWDTPRCFSVPPESRRFLHFCRSGAGSDQFLMQDTYWSDLASHGSALSLGRLRASPAPHHHRPCWPMASTVVQTSPQHRWHACFCLATSSNRLQRHEWAIYSKKRRSRRLWDARKNVYLSSLSFSLPERVS